MNKNLLYIIGIIVLIVLGYFALQNNDIQTVQQPAMSMEQVSETDLELFKDNIVIPFNALYSIDDDWSLKIIQFEPDAKILGKGMISSDSNQELNPAVKVEFYKNGDLVHNQISYKDMPGFHSIKPGQKYLLDLVDYKNFATSGDNSYSIENANVQIWIIK